MEVEYLLMSVTLEFLVCTMFRRHGVFFQSQVPPFFVDGALWLLIAASIFKELAYMVKVW